MEQKITLLSIRLTKTAFFDFRRQNIGETYQTNKKHCNCYHQKYIKFHPINLCILPITNLFYQKHSANLFQIADGVGFDTKRRQDM